MELTNPADIRALLARHDFRFSKSMGQNFLTAAWVPADIADASGADEHTAVLEVGPGIGCLTEQLAQRAAKVVSVELDERLRPVLAETLAACPNVEIVFGDVLALDLPQLAAERFDGLRPVVCANLPYNVTTPLITAFLTAGCFDTVTVMIQREAAHRLCARPGTADYGLLTVLTAWYAELELLFDVPPHCFVPAPKVTSTVVRLRMRSAPPADVRDEALLVRHRARGVQPAPQDAHQCARGRCSRLRQGARRRGGRRLRLRCARARRDARSGAVCCAEQCAACGAWLT